MSVETHKFVYGDNQLEFQLKRRPRKTLSISVKPNLSIEVVAPEDASLDRVLEKLHKRAPWIKKQLQFFDQFQPRTPERRYIAGETHRYLGRQYKLKVALHIQQDVKLFRGQLVVQTHTPESTATTKSLLENWYRDRAHLKFRERIETCRQRFANPDDFQPTGLIVRTLEQRWGSMTAKGNLILNWSLIRAPVDAIDYVITHELCHIEHAHHGPEFFKLLDRVMPDWEKRKLKLERQLA